MEYDATYKYGNTTIHVVAPEPKTQEEIDEILKEFHMAGWSIWEEIVAKMNEDGDSGCGTEKSCEITGQAVV